MNAPIVKLPKGKKALKNKCITANVVRPSPGIDPMKPKGQGSRVELGSIIKYKNLL